MVSSKEAGENVKEVLKLTSEEFMSLETKVENVFDSARNCRFSGGTGLLESYAAVAEKVLEFMPRIQLLREHNLIPFWDYVDEKIIQTLRDNCSCNIKQ